MDAAALQAGARLIGWVLVHSIWQGALVAALYGLLRTVLPRGNARYLLGMLALATLALCPVLTGAALWHATAAEFIPGTLPLPDFTVGGGDASMGANGRTLEAVLPWLALAWSCGVLLLSLRVWWQWTRLRALVRAAERLPAWQLKARRMARQFGLRYAVAVFRSGAISTPTLIGWLRPVIVLPAAMLSCFPAAQIEWLLAHELAHLRRLDPLCNLFQLILETLYFYHPAVRWISRDARNEREICCDALALSICGGDRLDFARALAGLADLREQHASLLLAANGGVLLDRVRRVVAEPPRREQVLARPLTMVMGLALAVAVASMIWRSPVMLSPRIDPLAAWSPQRVQVPAWPLVDLLPAHAQALRLVLGSGSSTLAAVPVPTRSTARMVPSAEPLQVADILPPSNVGSHLAAPVAAMATMATPVHMSQPVYPQDAYERGIEGRVVMAFSIDPDGRVRDAQVIHADPAGVFDLAALRAMRGWQFAPAGLTSAVRYSQTMVFSLHTAGGHAAGEAIDARIGCRVVTGTHICRLPEEANLASHRDEGVSDGLRQ